MNWHIVADGPNRVRHSAEFHARLRRIERSEHSLYLRHIITGEMQGNKPSQPSSC